MTPAKKKRASEAAEFLNNLTEFLGDTEGQSHNDIRKELMEEGVDVDRAIADVKNLVRQKISESKRAWLKDAPAQRSAILEKLNDVSGKILEDGARLREKIQDIVNSGTGGELASAFFRNYKSLPDDDLRSLYLDFLKLQSLKEEDDDEKKN